MDTIDILVDKNTISNNNNTITGKICFFINNNYFPDSNWNDFIVIVLNWWINSLLNIINDNQLEVDFMFMDGPFLIKVKPTGKKKVTLDLIKRVKINKIVNSFECDIKEVARAIFNTTKIIIDFVNNKKWVNDEINELYKYFLQLKKAIENKL